MNQSMGILVDINSDRELLLAVLHEDMSVLIVLIGV